MCVFIYLFIYLYSIFVNFNLSTNTSLFSSDKLSILSYTVCVTYHRVLL